MFSYPLCEFGTRMNETSVLSLLDASHFCCLRSLVKFLAAPVVLLLSVTALSFMQACVSLFLHSTSTRPMRTATRWFWAKGRTAWCTLGGTWATKSASPSRKSLRRTARMRTHPLFFFFCFFFPHSESLLTGKQSCTVFHKNYFFQNNPNGNGFGRGDSHWRALDPQCSLGIFGETDECLYTSFFACYSVIYTKSWSLNKRFGWRETWYLNHFLSICPTSLF